MHSVPLIKFFRTPPVLLLQTSSLGAHPEPSSCNWARQRWQLTDQGCVPWSAHCAHHQLTPPTEGKAYVVHQENIDLTS